MTILNIHIDNKDKKKVKDLTESQNNKSMSEFIRKLITEQIKIQETSLSEKESQKVKIPDYIPKNKYVGFIRGAIIAVSDNPSEIAQIAVKNFPDLPLVIKYNGAKKKQMEYCFLNLSELNCWKYAQVEESSYPIFPINFKTNLGEKILSSSIDTASSLCVLKKNSFDSEDFEVKREEKVSTATGIIITKMYSCEITIFNKKFNTEFILAPIADCFPFNALIGRNLLDQLDTYLFGKKQIICLKLAS